MSNIWKYSQTAGKMVNKLKHGAFTVTSIDNLDKLFSKVRVRLSKIGDVGAGMGLLSALTIQSLTH